jgi:cytochrome b
MPATDAERPVPPEMQTHSVRIWDLPTRLFHWVLAILVTGLVVSGNIGGNAMPVHALLGQGVLTLVLFRLLWGVVGGHWSRFTTFLPTPQRLQAYWQGLQQPQPHLHVGHNPLGAMSIVAMLLILLLQVASGMISDDEIAFTGPWAVLAPSDWVSWATSYHKTWGKRLLLGLVALHLLAILFHRLRHRHNLIPAMLHGNQAARPDTRPTRDNLAQRVLALVILLGCGALVRWLVAFGN